MVNFRLYVSGTGSAPGSAERKNPPFVRPDHVPGNELFRLSFSRSRENAKTLFHWGCWGSWLHRVIVFAQAYNHLNLGLANESGGSGAEPSDRLLELPYSSAPTFHFSTYSNTVEKCCIVQQLYSADSSHCSRFQPEKHILQRL